MITERCGRSDKCSVGARARKVLDRAFQVDCVHKAQEEGFEHCSEACCTFQGILAIRSHRVFLAFLW